MPALYGLHSLLRQTRQDLELGRKVQVAGGSGALSQLFLLSLALHSVGKQIVVIVPSPRDVSYWVRYFNTAVTFLSPGRKIDVVSLPYVTLYGNDRFVNPAVNRRQRLYALSKLLKTERTTIVLTTLPGLLQSTLCKKNFLEASFQVHLDSECDQDDMILRLEDLGYTSCSLVTEEGQFSVRGGILDVFPANTDFPCRLEWTFDKITSLRFFNLKDQKSISSVNQLTIVPCFDAITTKNSRRDDTQKLFNFLLEIDTNPSDRDGMVMQFQSGIKFAGFDMLGPLFRGTESFSSALDYLGPSTVFVFPGSEATAWARYKDFFDGLTISCAKDRERSRIVLPVDSHFLHPDAAKLAFQPLNLRVEFGNPHALENADLCRIESRLVLDGAPTLASQGAELFEKWLDLFEPLRQKRGALIIVLVHNEDQFDRIENLLKHRGIPVIRDPYATEKLILDELSPNLVYLGCGEIDGHIWLEDYCALIVSEEAMFGAKPRAHRSESQKLKNYLSSFADLKVGDLVVHIQHGIGRYLGLTSLSISDVTSEFLIIEYAGNDKIYLPVDRLSLLQRYSAGGEATGASHPLDRLGGGFERRKGRVKEAVREMAEELIKLQAKRVLTVGKAYSTPDDTYLKFEAAFPYDETADQVRAMLDVEADFLSGKPMDRLICGDVGFGKTEIALRAAMRTVLEGYQVLVLVPTTVLSFQHYRTFNERLSPFGVKVGQVNRFVKPSSIKESLADLEVGTLDVLVGTHRLLSQDVKPKRLGLLVVDEEQRFGVVHKERLKAMRSGAHVLTLTATPIPRTLHMSMIGLRDISIIATPPQDRLAVKTYIAPFDESLIKDAIQQEIKRGGQVFFVHNRLDDIEQMRLLIQSLLPGIVVRVGHGQMPEHQLERVIIDFLEGKFQVLLCTTIIESGIDMPHVNTLIVNRADRFGLSQLYQLRGRVGRSNIQAFAYFVTPPPEQLADDARKRLDVLAAHQELGAGFQIASHDLELRGAGHLLGDAQSGHASEVGLELYTELLDAAIQEIRGESRNEKLDTEIRIPVSAIIPNTYVSSEVQRLHLYKRLFGIQESSEITAFKKEMEDRFGPIPEECSLLFKVARVKQVLSRMGVIRLTAGRGGYELRFGEVSTSQAERLLKATKDRPDVYRIAPDNRLILVAPVPDRPSFAAQESMLNRLAELIDPLAP
jgi:transcription-repair coupling factor (superfamily II helicase)